MIMTLAEVNKHKWYVDMYIYEYGVQRSGV